MKRTNSVALPIVSAFTGRELVAVFSGFTRASKNAKTGRMIQCHLLDPSADLRRGPSASMCGGCWRRLTIAAVVRARREAAGVRPCYVRWARAPHTLQVAVAEGRVPRVSWLQLLELLRRRGDPVRLGATGDPVHLGAERIRLISAAVGGRVTGYTRAWAGSLGAGLASFLMASADTEDDAARAALAGWRPFRARRPGDGLAVGEVQCPAAAESGHAIQCARCLLCGPRGCGLPGVSIVDH